MESDHQGRVKRAALIVLLVSVGLGLWWLLGQGVDSPSSLPNPPGGRTEPVEGPDGEALESLTSTTSSRSEPGLPDERVAFPASSDSEAPLHFGTLDLQVALATKRTSYPRATFRLQAESESFAQIVLANNAPRLGDRLPTNAEGKVSIRVPAGSDFELEIFANDASLEDELWTVPSLEAGERRRGMVLLHPLDRRKVVLEVLTSESLQPIAGAEVRVQERMRSQKLFDLEPAPYGPRRELHVAETDAAGRCEFQLRPFRAHRLEVTADGRAEHVETVALGRLDVRPILLSPPARLRGVVQNEQGEPQGGLSVLAGEQFHTTGGGRPRTPRTKGLPRLSGRRGSPTWARVTTDENGTFELASLPAGVQLNIAVFEGTRRRHVVSRPLELRSGENEILIVMQEPTPLAGKLLDAQGGPVVGARLTLAQNVPTASHALAIQDERFTLALVETDGQGRFRFEDVPAGSWMIGLGLRQPPEVRDHIRLEKRLVETPLTGSDEEWLLTAHRNLFVQGTVESGDGTPIRQAHVNLRGNGVDLHTRPRGETFRFGPLVPGEYEIHARVNDLGSTARAIVSAGELDVRLRLRDPGAIRAVIRKGHEEKPGADFTVELTPLDALEAPLRVRTVRGILPAPEVEPGNWTLYAHEDGWYAFQARIVVERPGHREDIELIARRGGEVFLSVRGQVKRFRYSLEHQGATIVKGRSIITGRRERLTLPEGLTHILLSDEHGTPVDRQSVTLEPGERKQVIFRVGR